MLDVVDSGEGYRQPEDEVRAAARQAGFDLVGFVDARDMDRYAGVEVSYWEIRRSTLRPADIMPGVKSIIVLGYRVFDPVLDTAAFDPEAKQWVFPAYAMATLSRQRLARQLARRGYHLFRGRTDGLSYKRLAVLAGLGSFGRNALVINPTYGSNFRIACLLTDTVLEPSRPSSWDPCGDCQLCQEACPLGALTPYRVDPEACLVGLSLRERAGDMSKVDPSIRRRLDQVDVRAHQPRLSRTTHVECWTCQGVCPHNRQAQETAKGVGVWASSER